MLELPFHDRFVLLRVFLILLLVAANAFFAAAEFSLVSVRDTRIQQLIEAGASARASCSACTSTWTKS
jgi:CBS domain containing-hemolysin-like protein